MERTWLVQRLRKPVKRDNPFAFGGGLANGGLSDEAMSLLRGIFSFDYMGAAEFEFGAVPKALQAIAKSADELDAFSFSIPLADVAADWRDKRPAPDGDESVFVLCRKSDRREVEERIRNWAGEPYNRDLKETTQLSSALRPFHEWDGDTCGWLELNHGFMFFTDEEMWRKTADLFAVRAESAAPIGEQTA